jgi:toxin HigB-1
MYRLSMYDQNVIRSFRCTETKAIFQGIGSRKFRNIERTAFRKLAQLHKAASLQDLKSPGNSLEALTAGRKGQWSIRINDQFRLCFEWDGTDASDVEVVDYH